MGTHGFGVLVLSTRRRMLKIDGCGAQGAVPTDPNGFARVKRAGAGFMMVRAR